jgi:alcohol dehydrogenase class IV
MIDFDFSTSRRVIFRSGAINDIGRIAGEIGKKTLLVTGFHNQAAFQVKQNLISRGIEVIDYLRIGEPTIQTIKEGLKFAKNANINLIVACGGGSSIDTGKAISALMNNPGQLEDYLEIVGKGKKLSNSYIPLIAIPTTAGTGSEVTRNAVIRIQEKGIKVSLRGITLIPKIAIIDPELTLHLRPEITANTGMDALSQLIESYLTIKSNPLTDALCVEGMKRTIRSLEKAYNSGDDLVAREDLCIASLFSGIALANSGLGSVHGIAGVIGGLINAPHGALCARLLPYAYKINENLIIKENKESPLYKKIVIIHRLISGSKAFKSNQVVDYFENIVDKLKIKKLGDYGIEKRDFSHIISISINSSSMKGNPVCLESRQIRSILENAL